MSDEISNSLGLAPMVPKSIKVVDGENEAADYDLARYNIKNALSEVEQLAASSREVAEQSQSPRAYEVAGSLWKLFIEGNRELLRIAELKQTILDAAKKSEIPSNGDVINNNNLFVSGSDLQKILGDSGYIKKKA